MQRATRKMKRYAETADIEAYLKTQTNWSGSPENLRALANFFSEGAVTRVSNRVSRHLAEGGGVALVRGAWQSCRCASCQEWHVVDEEGKVVDRCNSLVEWAQR